MISENVRSALYNSSKSGDLVGCIVIKSDSRTQRLLKSRPICLKRFIPLSALENKNMTWYSIKWARNRFWGAKLALRSSIVSKALWKVDNSFLQPLQLAGNSLITSFLTKSKSDILANKFVPPSNKIGMGTFLINWIPQRPNCGKVTITLLLLCRVIKIVP